MILPGTPYLGTECSAELYIIAQGKVNYILMKIWRR